MFKSAALSVNINETLPLWPTFRRLCVYFREFQDFEYYNTYLHDTFLNDVSIEANSSSLVAGEDSVQGPLRCEFQDHTERV